VADNLVRLRKARGLSTTRLSAALKGIGHSIPATGITRIEKGERRVDVDDLVALAVALDVSPTAFLLPPTVVGEVDVAGGKTVKALNAWMWVNGRRPLDTPDDEEEAGAALDDHQIHSLPPGLRKWRPQDEVTVTLEDQVPVVAAMRRVSEEDARREVYRRAGIEDEGKQS
jgi:transcriptional regulator with XRE-family HTH domain